MQLCCICGFYFFEINQLFSNSVVIIPKHEDTVKPLSSSVLGIIPTEFLNNHMKILQ